MFLEGKETCIAILTRMDSHLESHIGILDMSEPERCQLSHDSNR